MKNQKSIGENLVPSRCPWCVGDALYEDYHDNEWGIPVYNDRLLFEMLILEGAQAGLSWLTVLKKRINYRAAFHNFNCKKIAAYTARDIKRLMGNAGLIRNRLKMEASIKNAKAVLAIQKEYGSLSNYLWRFVDGRPQINRWSEMSQVPARSAESDAMSRELKKRGMNFVGSTICYAFMQAVGMVNDHLTSCFRHNQTANQSNFAKRP